MSTLAQTRREITAIADALQALAQRIAKTETELYGARRRAEHHLEGGNTGIEDHVARTLVMAEQAVIDAANSAKRAENSARNWLATH